MRLVVEECSWRTYGYEIKYEHGSRLTMLTRSKTMYSLDQILLMSAHLNRQKDLKLQVAAAPIRPASILREVRTLNAESASH